MHNYKHKKELIADVKAGKQVSVFPAQTNGEVTLEGPHYPAPHTWYAQATIKDSIITKVK